MSKKQNSNTSTEAELSSTKQPPFKNLLFDRIIVIIGVLLNIACNVTIIKNSKSLTFLTPYVPETWNFESKLTTLAMISQFIGCYFLLITAHIWNLRFTTGNINPVNNVDPESIVCLNRVLQNTVEQTFVFLPSLAYWVLKLSTEDNKHEAVLFGFIFVCGRIIFLVGYYFGTLIGLQTLRSFGMGLTYFVSVILIQRNFGLNLI